MHARPRLAAPLLGLLCLLGLVASAAPAHASKPRLRLEQVDTSRCPDRGEVTASAVELELEGTLRPSSPRRYRLIVDGARLDRPPLRATSFAKTARPLELVLVVQVCGLSARDLVRVRAGLSHLVRLVPRRSRFTIITYDWQARRLVTRVGRSAALATLAALEPSAIVVDPALVEALGAGLRALPRRGGGVPGAHAAAAGTRELMVVFSDGINRSPKRDLFRAVGSKARARGVPLHPVAYSAIDEWGPLLNLGEIAKRSGGTFRWATSAARIDGELVNLAREINEQLVLTFEVPGRCARGQRFQLSSDGLVSGVVVVEKRAARAARQAAGGGGWSPLGVAGFIGGVVLVMVCLVLLTRWLLRNKPRPRDAAGPDAPASKGPAAAPDQPDQPLGEGYWLVGAGPRELGLRLEIPAGRSRLGSASDCRVRLPAGSAVAPHHAVLRLKAGRLTVEAVDAAYPVLVNGRDAAEPTRLSDGDMLLVGPVQLLVRHGG